MHKCQPQSEAAALLKAVLLDPHKALYVRNINSQNMRTRYLPFDFNATLTPLSVFPKADLELFERASKDCRLLDEEEKDDWITSLRGGDEEVIVALLLALLPNFTIISLKIPHPHSMGIPEFLTYISEPENKRFLPHLASVRLYLDEHVDVDVFGPYEWVQAFASLPSIDSLSLTGHHAKIEDSSHFPDYEIQSPIKDLRIKNCGIPKGQLCIILGVI